jgi:hypothetical protein
MKEYEHSLNVIVLVMYCFIMEVKQMFNRIKAKRILKKEAIDLAKANPEVAEIIGGTIRDYVANIAMIPIEDVPRNDLAYEEFAIEFFRRKLSSERVFNKCFLQATPAWDKLELSMYTRAIISAMIQTRINAIDVSIDDNGVSRNAFWYLDKLPHPKYAD